VTGAKRSDVALEHVTLELPAKPSLGRLHRPPVEPAEYAQREEILAAIDFALAQVETLESFAVERRERDFDQLETVAR
jgi:hypothetical protein